MGPEYNRLKKLVDEHVLDFLPEIDRKSQTLYDAMRYSLTAGGKRLRSVLLLSAYQMATGPKADLNYALPFAVSCEYIHTYSLIHDDLPAMDDDDYRRGVPTNHKVYGEAAAILAGDGLLSSAYEAMTKDMMLYFDQPELLNCKLRAMFALTKATGCRGMVAGQVADMEAEDTVCSAEMLSFIHANKTAAFIKGSICAGLYLGGASRDMCRDGEILGENLGIAFQIVDDILDVIGDSAAMGKSTGSDVKQAKSTYPALYGIDESKGMALEYLGKASAAVEKYYDEAEVFNDIIKFLKEQIQ